jgi:membrane-anchored protein YejM (alkaline phosphatase superfamily)
VFKPIANAFGLAEERLNPARRIRSWPMETDRRPAREWGGLWVVFELVLAVLYVTGSHRHLGIAAVYAAGAAAVLIAVIVGRGYMTVLLFAGGLQYVVFGVAGFLLWHERVRGVIALVGGTLVLAAAFARWRRRPTL